MSRSQWKTLAGVDFARLREARIQAHYGAQWLARAARAYVPPQPDDGHTNLGWDDGFEGFTTHPLQARHKARDPDTGPGAGAAGKRADRPILPAARTIRGGGARLARRANDNVRSCGQRAR